MFYLMQTLKVLLKLSLTHVWLLQPVPFCPTCRPTDKSATTGQVSRDAACSHIYSLFIQAANSTLGGQAACCCRHNPLSRPKSLLGCVCLCLYLTCCSDCAHAAWSYQCCCQELLVPAQAALWQDTRVRATAHHTKTRHNTVAPPACPGCSCIAIGKSWHPVHAAPTQQQHLGGQAACFPGYVCL